MTEDKTRATPRPDVEGLKVGDIVYVPVEIRRINQNYFDGLLDIGCGETTIVDLFPLRKKLAASGHLNTAPAAPTPPGDNGWMPINYAEASWKTMPKSGQVVLAVLEGCDTGKQIYAVLEYVPQSDSTWLSDGCELSNAWDVIRWKPLDDLPAPPTGKGE